MGTGIPWDGPFTPSATIFSWWPTRKQTQSFKPRGAIGPGAGDVLPGSSRLRDFSGTFGGGVAKVAADHPGASTVGQGRRRFTPGGETAIRIEKWRCPRWTPATRTRLIGETPKRPDF